MAYVDRSYHIYCIVQDEQSDEDSDSQWVEKRLDGDMEEKPVADKLKHPEGQLQVCLMNIL